MDVGCFSVFLVRLRNAIVVLFFGWGWAFCECMMVFSLVGSMKVVISGDILIWQKRESHVSVSLGA